MERREEKRGEERKGKSRIEKRLEAVWQVPEGKCKWRRRGQMPKGKGRRWR